MIIKAVLYLLYALLALVTYPLRIFDDVSGNSDILSAVVSARDYIANVSQIIPTTALISAVALIVTIEFGGIYVYKGVMWTLKRIPFLK